MENENINQNNIKSFQLVIASKNIHKIREIKTILNEVIPNIDLLSLIDFPEYIPPEESGTSFEDNAKIKAIHAAKALNRWVISDDSGLVVPALNGEPGIFSARYAGDKATDSDNRKKLLSKLADLSDNDLYAYFECCIAIASPDSLKKSVCAKCEGRIETQERGGEGFGYDPLFVKHDYNQTFAQLKAAVKNKISHRRKALDKIAITIESLAIAK
ncbi:MAG: Non-canonical purine NTP pyrophosphatase [Candidatus Anoxychlamydiales bacterium]|uniref:dITP/XTP pyrophosphatase n=1 Tax=marine sediment metagenome TaxID=412755 RepID=A0A0F9GFL4_9ZZZZ|nr:Non-canonical purine NTP pyrophosphatase [Candidatus Anoxychlamydiales bacterium]NGX40462.1 Non-canonical purine NTP pyrophosphatase [Candidatus Anoxychlamydiales bacterium]HEU64879.1 RdgB/HAM1 family non-canonical purine NTP pyrophosphatase [Chlamydiota bacterium]